MNYPATAPLRDQEVKTSSKAIWSLVLGILSISCLWLLGSIPAIILGIIALKAIEESGGSLKGRGMGIAGIVTGSVGVFTGIGMVGVMAGLSLPAYSSMRQRAQETKTMSEVRQLLFACKVYAVDNKGAYPPSLQDLLVDGQFKSEDLLFWKMDDSSDSPLPYLYRSGLNDMSPADEPLIAAPEPLLGKRVVGYSDASVSSVEEEEFQAGMADLFR